MFFKTLLVIFVATWAISSLETIWLFDTEWRIFAKFAITHEPAFWSKSPKSQVNQSQSLKWVKVSSEYCKKSQNKMYAECTNHSLTHALLGPWIFHCLLGGGGVFERPPPVWKKNERRRSKAREKSSPNHFGHFFLAQVEIEVFRGKNSIFFPKRFFEIKCLILKVEQRFWYHRVCLIKARRTIYKMTLTSQVQSLTSCQVRPRSRGDKNGSYCISVDLPGRDERTDTNPTSLTLLD